MISTSRGIRPQLAMAIALVTAFTPPLHYSSDPEHKGSRREANRVGDSLICHDILNTRIPKDYVPAKTNSCLYTWNVENRVRISIFNIIIFLYYNYSNKYNIILVSNF
jgi:hypothetical protein